MYKATAILSVRLSVRMSGTLELGFRGSRAFPIAGAKVWNSLPDDCHFRSVPVNLSAPLSDTARTYSVYSGPRGGVAAFRPL